MFPLSPSMWAGIGGILLVVGLGLYGKVQTSRLDACKAEFSAFQAKVEAEGLAAQNAAKITDLANQKAKDSANAKIKQVLADNSALVKRLRQANTPQIRLPDPPANTRRPDLFCVDRAQYQREDGILIAKLLEGARSLADEGTAYSMRLSTLQEWSKSVGSR